MSISALGTGLSGLQAYQRALDSTSHNIANAGTADFQSQQVNFKEVGTGGVVVNISSDGNKASLASGTETSGTETQASDTDLATELVNSLKYKAGFDLSAKMIKAADAVLGTLIDIKS